MKHDAFWYAAAAALCAAWLLMPCRGAAARHELGIHFEGDADRCSDLRVHSSGQVARVAESFSLPKSEARTLEVDAPERGVIHVRGWDRDEYSVEACKIAAADDATTAGDLLKGIAISHTAGRFTFKGPANDAGRWEVYLIVRAPKDASLDLESHNGPIDVGGVSGAMKLRAVNGPVSISGSSGTVEAHTTNGPISFAGGSGDVHLNAQNGPISVRLSGDVWDGPGFEASTVNGPVSLSLPDKFRSGVRLESSGYGPINCRASACAGASMNAAKGRRTVEWNGSIGTIRISTDRGPISVSDGKFTRTV